MPLRRWLAILLVVVMVLPMTLQVNAGGPSNVSDVVPDRVLRALINEKLNEVDPTEPQRQATDPISADDMAKLEGEDASALGSNTDIDNKDYISKKDLCSDGLDASQKTIRSLEGLQYATNLKSLDLSGNQITDLTPLKDLTKLTYLDLYSNQITDIGPLEGFLDRMNKGENCFAWLVAQKAPDWKSPVLVADPEGGTVSVPNSNFPAIGQLAELKNDQVTFDQSVEISAVNLKG